MLLGIWLRIKADTDARQAAALLPRLLPARRMQDGPIARPSCVDALGMLRAGGRRRLSTVAFCKPPVREATGSRAGYVFIKGRRRVVR